MRRKNTSEEQGNIGERMDPVALFQCQLYPYFALKSPKLFQTGRTLCSPNANALFMAITTSMLLFYSTI